MACFQSGIFAISFLRDSIPGRPKSKYPLFESEIYNWLTNMSRVSTWRLSDVDVGATHGSFSVFIMMSRNAEHYYFVHPLRIHRDSTAKWLLDMQWSTCLNFKVDGNIETSIITSCSTFSVPIKPIAPSRSNILHNAVELRQ
jgi:hypothetical protein